MCVCGAGQGVIGAKSWWGFGSGVKMSRVCEWDHSQVATRAHQVAFERGHNNWFSLK